MSEQLEIIRLKQENKKLESLKEKQFHTIQELSELIKEIAQTLQDVDAGFGQGDLVKKYATVINLINLKVKRAANYMYLPERPKEE